MSKRPKGKAFVKSRFPGAHAERWRTNGHEVYFLIRDGRKYMYMSSGDTEGEAWRNAAAKIESDDLKAKAASRDVTP